MPIDDDGLVEGLAATLLNRVINEVVDVLACLGFVQSGELEELAVDVGLVGLELLWRFDLDKEEGVAARVFEDCVDARGDGLRATGLVGTLDFD
ncbi:MAG: hypothetical protein M0Z85_07680 [Gammaproteobacteria bacterium]|nr:hypothetical protein [Gammaproteobacteria bacterium]